MFELITFSVLELNKMTPLSFDIDCHSRALHISHTFAAARTEHGTKEETKNVSHQMKRLTNYLVNDLSFVIAYRVALIRSGEQLSKSS